MEVEKVVGGSHFVLVPLFAQGHMIPMIDMARVLAKQGAIVTLLTTPMNSPLIINSNSNNKIRMLELGFPSEKAGLPCGCESLDAVPSPHLITNFYAALEELRGPLEEHLLRIQDHDHGHPPSCIISDKYISWTSETAKRFGIPRIVFHGTGCFSLFASHNLRVYNPQKWVRSDSEPFLIPNLPRSCPRVEVTRAQLPGSLVSLPHLEEIRRRVLEAEESSYGVVVNTWEGLEKELINSYKNSKPMKQMRVWCIGPLSLCNEEVVDKIERGNRKAISNFSADKIHSISSSSSDNNTNKLVGRFLDDQKSCSVIYVCLGSQCRLLPSQLIEIGLGLEASNHPFIWVIKTEPKSRQAEIERWLQQQRSVDSEDGLGFEERVRGRGLVIKGWAPQLLILSHPSIRAFLTHCGWNSVIEGLSCGVPLITWPQFAEQFLNEKLVVEVLKVGFRVGVDRPVRWGDEEKTGVLVSREQVTKALNYFIQFEASAAEDQIRRACIELGHMARKAVQLGGSSHYDLCDLVQHFNYNNNNNHKNKVDDPSILIT